MSQLIQSVELQEVHPGGQREQVPLLALKGGAHEVQKLPFEQMRQLSWTTLQSKHEPPLRYCPVSHDRQVAADEQEGQEHSRHEEFPSK